MSYIDARISIKDILGLQLGDAHIIRNAGGIATDDAISSLLIHMLSWYRTTYCDKS